jgi:Phage tail protein (Tail_P2_I)
MTQSLYQLLPEFYRVRDPSNNRALQALMEVLQSQYDALETNIGALYDAWFVETCPDWVVPYIAQLLGIKGLDEADANLPQQRARVANTLTYRAYKGTMPVFGDACGNATGWPALALDGATRLVAAQNVAAVRSQPGGSVDLTDQSALMWIGTPFQTAPRCASFTHEGFGPCLPASVTVAFWRLQSYPLRGITPGRFKEESPCYTFHPFGIDTPLFLMPKTRTDILAPPRPDEIPLALTRRHLASMIARCRAGEAVDTPFTIHVRHRGVWRIIPLGVIAVLDLKDWTAPPPRFRWGRAANDVVDIEAAVDPELGRFRLAASVDVDAIAVDYAYGFHADLGGGPYDRQDQLSALDPTPWSAVVWADVPGAPPDPLPPGAYRTLREALAAWHAQPGDGHIRIADSATHAAPSDPLRLDGRRLMITACDGCRPCLTGKVVVDGGASSYLLLDGLLLDKAVTVQGGAEVHIDDCTIRPPQTSFEQPGGRGIDLQLQDRAPSALPSLRIRWSIVGPITIRGAAPPLVIEDSIVAGGSGPPINIDFLTKLQEFRTSPAEILLQFLLQLLLQFLLQLSNTTQLGRRPLSAPVRQALWPTAPRNDAPAISADLIPNVVSTMFGSPNYGEFARPRALSSASDIRTLETMFAAFEALRSKRLDNLEPVREELLPQGLNFTIHLAD